MKLDELTELFRRLGARNPEAWASSQITDGLAQVDRIIEYVETNMDQSDIEAHLELSSAYDIRLGNLPYEEKAARHFRHLLRAAELGAGPIVSLAAAHIYLQPTSTAL